MASFATPQSRGSSVSPPSRDDLEAVDASRGPPARSWHDFRLRSMATGRESNLQANPMLQLVDVFTIGDVFTAALRDALDDPTAPRLTVSGRWHLSGTANARFASPAIGVPQ